MFQDEQDTTKNLKTMGCALKIQSILGKELLKIKCMVERIIFVFILGFGLLRRSTSCIHAVVSILQHPVNPVRGLVFYL